MNRVNIGKKEIIHFVGIGGIGMSGLAQIMKTMGLNVQGSDLYKNKTHDSKYARFLGMITNIDENFGKIYELICSLDLVENTILIL